MWVWSEEGIILNSIYTAGDYEYNYLEETNKHNKLQPCNMRACTQANAIEKVFISGL